MRTFSIQWKTWWKTIDGNGNLHWIAILKAEDECGRDRDTIHSHDESIFKISDERILYWEVIERILLAFCLIQFTICNNTLSSIYCTCMCIRECGCNSTEMNENVAIDMHLDASLHRHIVSALHCKSIEMQLTLNNRINIDKIYLHH